MTRSRSRDEGPEIRGTSDLSGAGREEQAARTTSSTPYIRGARTSEDGNEELDPYRRDTYRTERHLPNQETPTEPRDTYRTKRHLPNQETPTEPRDTYRTERHLPTEEPLRTDYRTHH
ncbi:hypothetical protein NHX12_032937 [Muraenolepis orangiensis]|uniref:Uncharacterized protein n=1 Tax=Muraenolepis orangiensis TaxID=630683 RepID=A0A9Q0IHI9_9TELE|nr:hypothetical protein NHX12_032937 [Muraenolepis orangiensis]